MSYVSLVCVTTKLLFNLESLNKLQTVCNFAMDRIAVSLLSYVSNMVLKTRTQQKGFKII